MARVTLTYIIQHGRLSTLADRFVHQSPASLTRITCKTPSRFINGNIQVCITCAIIHIVAEHLEYQIILVARIKVHRCTRLFRCIVVQFHVPFNLAISTILHCFSKNSIITRIIPLPSTVQ